MSLYGALYAGVAGLQGQSNKLGIISDNIANVNTIGYKQGSAEFESLVTTAAGASSYSPGGVIGGNQQLITTQGLLQTTTSPTDISITGAGMFVANTTADLSGQVVYTRSGSFTQDNQGNFVNTNGMFLEAWPLDRNGNLPGAPGNLNTTSSANLSSLQVVNVQNLTGTAAGTTTVALGANLNAGETAYPGASKTVTMDTSDTVNSGIAAKDIIVPTSVDSLTRGDQFEVATGSGLNYSYTYGGFTYSRNSTDGTASGDGDSGQNLRSSPTTLGANPMHSVGGGSSSVVVTQANNGLHVGDVVTLSGATAVGGITAAQLTGSFLVTAVTGNTYTITTTGSDAAVGGTTSGGSSVTSVTRPFVGDILDSTNPTQPFLGTTGTSGFTSAGLTFSVNTAASGTVTFTYTSSSPNATLGQFNNLTNLAAAINNVNGLSARVVNNRLFVGATDANAAVTFSNGSDTGVSGPPVQAGIDWVGELGLSNITTGTNRFSTMQGLAALVNGSPGLTATVDDPLAASDVKINVNDPLDTVTFSDRPVAAPLTALTTATPFSTTSGSNVVTVTKPTGATFQDGDIVTLNTSGMTLAPGDSYNGIPLSALTGGFVISNVTATTFDISVAATATASGPDTTPAVGSSFSGLVITPPNNSGSVLAALGLGPTLNGTAYTTPESTGSLGPAYDPTDVTKNMASGAIAPQFSRPITIYDALGTPHNLNAAFLKTGANSWAVEIYSQPAGDVVSSQANGQIAYGTVTFNGDGSLRSASSSLIQPLNINWTNSATPSTVTFNLGTAGQPFGTPNASAIGKTDGLSQFNSDYNVNFVNQNGAPVGKLTGVSIDSNGYITASYNNGETQKLYKIPLASFADANQLAAISGNAYTQTAGSGEVNLRQAGSSGVGTMASGSLETSNVELANQLTDMIVAQRAYQANTKVISTADELLSDLDQIIQ